MKQNTASDKPLTYELRIEPKGVDFSIAEEALMQDRGQSNPFPHITASRSNIHYFDSVDQRKLVRPTWDINPFESALSQVPKMFSEPAEWRRSIGFDQ